MKETENKIDNKKKQIRALIHELKDIEFKLIDLGVDGCSEQLESIIQKLNHQYMLLTKRG